MEILHGQSLTFMLYSDVFRPVFPVTQTCVAPVDCLCDVFSPPKTLLYFIHYFLLGTDIKKRNIWTLKHAEQPLQSHCSCHVGFGGLNVEIVSGFQPILT